MTMREERQPETGHAHQRVYRRRLKKGHQETGPKIDRLVQGQLVQPEDSQSEEEQRTDQL